MGQGRTTFHLTYRQQQIVDLVLEGANNRQIAERLGLSQQTIKNQLTTIYQKLGISNRLQLAMLAVRERKRPS
jgi:DNA-binding NarL/FixJ family response regulator